MALATTFYADLPARRARQIVSDLFIALWVLVWAVVGTRVDHAVMTLAGPGREIADAGRGLEDNLRSAGDKIDNVPLVGDDVRTPFDRAGDAGASLRSAGEAQISAVDHLATILGFSIAAVPIIVVLAIWLPRRIRFVRNASSTRTLIGIGADLDLFALRALARRSTGELARIHPDPAAAWRAQDPAVVQALAELELRSEGLRPPHPRREPSAPAR